MSDSVRPQRQQPTRLPRPWDSPSKNTGVGCHFLLHAWKWKVKVKSLSRVWLLRPHGLQPKLLPPWEFPGKSTGVGCHCLLCLLLLWLHICYWISFLLTWPRMPVKVLSTKSSLKTASSSLIWWMKVLAMYVSVANSGSRWIQVRNMDCKYSFW